MTGEGDVHSIDSLLNVLFRKEIKKSWKSIIFSFSYLICCFRNKTFVCESRCFRRLFFSSVSFWRCFSHDGYYYGQAVNEDSLMMLGHIWRKVADIGLGSLS